MHDYLPDGWHSITPRLIVGDPAAAVDFMKRAFAASGEFSSDAPALMTIGDSIVMVSAGPRKTTSSLLHLYVPDADATFKRALEAGAIVVEEPADMPYGDRRAMVEDPFGNFWQIATYRGDISGASDGS
jgi:PhnB protein